MAQWVEHWPVKQRVPDRFLARVHTWVAGQVPGAGNCSVFLSHIDVSLLFLLPSPSL